MFMQTPTAGAGKAYYDMHGREISLPPRIADRPDGDLLRTRRAPEPARLGIVR
jgi:hypothetical protein